MVPTSITEASNRIREIDRRIDAGRLNRSADHFERECALFRERGEVQLVRAVLEAARAKSFRTPPQKKCPACHGSGIAKAA